MFLNSSKKLQMLLLFMISTASIKAQVLKGNLKAHKFQQVTLTGFNHYKTYQLAKTTTDSTGSFTLNYPNDYKGVALLKSGEKNGLVVILDEPIVEIEGVHLSKPNSVFFKKSKPNMLFSELADNYRSRAQVYGAWRYLASKYSSLNELKKESKAIDAIRREINRIEEKDNNQLTNLPANSYLKWYMPKRKLLSDMPESIHKYNERISQHIQQFRNIDFTHKNFKTSGLFKELIEGHYFLLENMGESLDDIYLQMNLSTDYLVNNLKGNNSLLNVMSDALFRLFEKRSLFPAAEHLSKRLLNDESYELEGKLAKKLEKYKTLKIGSKAPDIQLNAGLKLSDLKKNVLLIFGASNCPHCKNELQELQKFHHQWKSKLEIVYISLDTQKSDFEKTYKDLQWQTYCDFMGWETKAAQDYFVSATPTYLLIDKNMKILQHPTSLGQVNAWVDYKL